MAITIEWVDEEKTIIKWMYQGQWTWDELAAALRTQNERLGNINEDIPVIVDMRESYLLPQNVLGNLKPMGELLSLTPSKFVVMIITNSYVKTIFNTYTKAFPKAGGNTERVIVSTWDEALAVIAKKRGQQTSY
jgi:hypothetical protein